MKRVLTSLILLAIFIYVTLWSPQWIFLLMVSLVGVFCFYEYANLVESHAIRPPGAFGYVAGLLLLLLPENSSSFVMLIALLALALGLRMRELPETLPYAACLVLGILYVFGGFRAGVALRALSPWWLFFALSVNWIGDTAAYYAGRAIGRHKLSPTVSPGKTWEGAIASVSAAAIYGAIYFPKLLPGVPLPKGLGIAVLANIAGQIGDLAESALKRGAGVKDSGSMLPGHGGWLDRVDSSLFAMPVVYFVLRNLRWE